MDMGLNKMDEMKMFTILMIGVFILGGIAIALVIYDGMYKYPIASEKANTHCKAIGFDQHKSFSRVGILSEEPVGIKCEYAERYTDLGVRSNS